MTRFFLCVVMLLGGVFLDMKVSAESFASTTPGGVSRISDEALNWTTSMRPTFGSTDIYASDSHQHAHHSRAALSVRVAGDEKHGNISECILLFGAFCNGNLGDVIQPIAMEHILSSIAPNQCLWYAHSESGRVDVEDGRGQFFGSDDTRLISLAKNDADRVNRFKATIVGGGGLFVSPHVPLNSPDFAGKLTLPIVIMGVGASYMVKRNAIFVKKAVFVSGRDKTSTSAFSALLRHLPNPVVQPEDVVLVRDPVLSDKMLSDTDGKCWRQSEGENQQPLCFVLPASNSATTTAMNQFLVDNVVRRGDVFVNVFPKHQKEIEMHKYPGEVEQILDPNDYTKRMCSCRAIISTRLHGVVLGLHMGVPTFGAFHTTSSNKVPELIFDIMGLPEHFFLIDKHLTREVVDLEVEALRQIYAQSDRRAVIHEQLSGFYEDFKSHARHVLFDLIGIQQQ